MTETYLQLGALGIIFIFCIKEFFAYLKSRKNGNSHNNEILTELQNMNNNHLHSIEECIRSGNIQLINTIHQDNTQIISALGEIKGLLRGK